MEWFCIFRGAPFSMVSASLVSQTRSSVRSVSVLRVDPHATGILATLSKDKRACVSGGLEKKRQDLA